MKGAPKGTRKKPATKKQAAKKAPEFRQDSGPETPEVPEYPAEAREGGRWTAGGPSPCPGGRGLANTRFARRVREATKDGGDIVDFHLEVLGGTAKMNEVVSVKDVGPVLFERGPNITERQMSAKALREWGWGKALPSSQMVDPDELERPAATDGSPAAVLDVASTALAEVVLTIRAMVQQGALPSPELVQALGTTSSAFATLAKERRELDKADPASKLPTEELRKQALAAMSEDELREELQRRKAGAA